MSVTSVGTPVSTADTSMSGMIWPRALHDVLAARAFNHFALAVNSSRRATMSSGDRHARVRANTADEQCLRAAGVVLVAVGRIALGVAAIANLADDAGALGNAHHIENQRHAAVAIIVAPANEAMPFNRFPSGFDDDLFRVVNGIDDEAKLPVVRLRTTMLTAC